MATTWEMRKRSVCLRLFQQCVICEPRIVVLYFFNSLQSGTCTYLYYSYIKSKIKVKGIPAVEALLDSYV